MLWIVLYIIVGIAVFFGLRVAFRKAKFDTAPHDKIWTHWFISPEGWLVPILFWPIFALASLAWFGAELFHETGKREIARHEEIEAKRDKRYDHLTLDEKIVLLESEAKKKQ